MLKPFYQTPDQEFEEKQISYQRCKKHYDEVMQSFPSLELDCQLSVTEIGKTCIRAFIYLPEGVSQKDTRALIKWLNEFMGNNERNFRKESGKFYWRGEKKDIVDEHGNYDFLTFLENTHPLTCEIVKVKKEVEVYESICK